MATHTTQHSAQRHTLHGRTRVDKKKRKEKGATSQHHEGTRSERAMGGKNEKPDCEVRSSVALQPIPEKQFQGLN